MKRFSLIALVLLLVLHLLQQKESTSSIRNTIRVRGCSQAHHSKPLTFTQR
jgi:hypothetical protein